MKPSDPDFKSVTLRRALTACTFAEGTRVKLRKGHRRGNVMAIHNDIHAINWTRNIPHFIEVKFDDGVTMLAHYSQLKRAK